MARHLFRSLLLFMLVGAGCTANSGEQEPSVNRAPSPTSNISVTTPESTAPKPAATEVEETLQEAQPAASPTELATAETAVEEPALSLAQVERLARAELAAVLEIAEAEIETVESHAQTWPDDALGCEDSRRIVVESQPVAGFQIILAVDGEEYDYRADDEGNVALCQDTEDVGKPLDPIR